MKLKLLNWLLRRYMWVYEIIDGDKGFVLAKNKEDAIQKLSSYYKDEDITEMISNENMYVYDADHSYIEGDVFNIVPW